MSAKPSTSRSEAMRAADGTAFALSGSETAPPVTLIHGLGLDSGMWRGLLPALEDRYRVLSYDLYGHGQSPAPPEEPTLALFARQLVGLLDLLGISRASLIGFSLGGMINRRVAIDAPGRTAALAILNSPHERGAEAQRLVEKRAAESRDGPAATIDETLARWFTPGFRAARPDVVAAVRATVLANEPGPYAACRRVLAAGVPELIRPEPPITAPTLVMTCENDTGSTPAMARAIAAEIAGAETVEVPELQHLGLIERPDVFAGPLLRFLERLPREEGKWK